MLLIISIFSLVQDVLTGDKEPKIHANKPAESEPSNESDYPVSFFCVVVFFLRICSYDTHMHVWYTCSL